MGLANLTTGNIVSIVVLACIMFFTTKWILKRFYPAKKVPVFLCVLSAFLLGPLLYLALIELLIFRISYTPENRFSKARWHVDPFSRFTMAKDITESKMLIGRDSNEGKKILGDPQFRRGPQTIWVYDMGHGGGGLGFRLHFLHVALDKGIVQKVDHVRFDD